MSRFTKIETLATSFATSSGRVSKTKTSLMVTRFPQNFNIAVNIQHKISDRNRRAFQKINTAISTADITPTVVTCAATPGQHCRQDG
jgi:hypothetical protein